MVVNMSKGNVFGILLKFSLPMLLSTVFQQMYNLADSIVAGKYAGLSALASVGASYPVTMIFISVASGFSIGAAVVVSRYFGAERFSKLKTCIFTSLITSVSAAAVLTIMGLLLSRSMLTALKTDELIMNSSVMYLNIYCRGLVFLFLYNIVNGIFTAMGDSKTPLFFLIISSVGNIFLDVLFVKYFNMGVEGVAWATFICQTVCSLTAFVVLLFRLKDIPPNNNFRLFDIKMLATISKIAVPSILQQSFVSVGNLFIQRLINSFGVAATGGYSAAIKLNTVAVSSFTAMSSSVSSFTSQNVGAKKYSRIFKGYRCGALIVCCAAACFTALFLFLREPLIGAFLDLSAAQDVEAVNIGSRFLLIVSPFYLFVSLKIVADGVLRGTGNMKGFMFATLFDLIIRVALAFILAPHFGTDGVWFSWPIGWCAAAAVSQGLYYTGKWRKLRDNEEYYTKM